MDTLVEILFFLSTALMVPVIAVLLGFVAWVLLEIGGLLREAQERHQGRSAWRVFLTELRDWSTAHDRNSTALLKRAAPPKLLDAFFACYCEFGASELHLGKQVSDAEIDAAGRLARMSLGVRVGPMLGLMGTLIPLGPALIGLSTGSIEEMARHLVVAFSTTVLGLFVGGTCYGIWLARRQWYARDLADIEYVYHCLHGAEGEPTSVSVNSQPRQETLLASPPAGKP